MKKTFLWMALMLLFVGKASAARFWVEDFEIAANESKTIDINLDNTEDIFGYVLWLKLPEGVTIDSDKWGLLIETTSRFNNQPESNYSEGYYKITAATGGRPVSGTSGTAILRIPITASDQISTGAQTMEIVHQQITVDNAQGDPVTIDQESSEYTCTTKVNVTTAASGYGTFSWPRALDFTGSGLEAYVATKDENSWLHMEQVTQVPAHTGIVIKGTASTTYNPTVIDDATLAQTNLLSPTDEAAVPVTTDGYYALATKTSKGTAFYEVDATKGISIPKYKAYLIHSGSAGADEAVFMTMEGETTGINGVLTEEQGVWYNLQGVRVQNPTQRGIYIRDGKKKVIK